MNIAIFLIYSISIVVAVAGILFIFFSFDSIENSIQIDEVHLYQFDYIIVGAGTCGSVLANRLSENPNISVLLIEAGGQFGVESIIPLFSTQMQNTTVDWSFQSTAQQYSSDGLVNKKQFLPRGKGLGGSSQLNYLLHFNGLKRDFERWSENGANIEWGHQMMNKYLRQDIDRRFHSRKKNHLKSIFCTIRKKCSDPRHEKQKIVLKTTAIDSHESGLAQALIAYSNESNEMEISLAKYNTWKGIRWSVYHSYLRPTFVRENLKILTNTRVHRILFNSNGHAIGVETSPDTELNKIFRLSSQREIIVSAGAYQSPQILKLSGIGGSSELNKFHIKTIYESPNIGENLYDHLSMPIFVSINDSISITKNKALNPLEWLKYLLNGTGIFSNFGVVGVINAKNKDYGLAMFGIGTIDENLMRDLANYKQRTFRQLFPRYNNSTQEGFVLLCTCYQPKSRGSIKLTSNRSEIPPQINPNYLQSEYDINCTINAIRMAIELVESKAFRQIDAQIHWPQLTECQHFIGASNKLPEANRQYLECIIRVGGVTAHHPGGTCSMGRKNDQQPLDNRMRVRGVSGLRVVDASILPTPISGTPNSILVTVAERAANIILNDYFHN